MHASGADPELNPWNANGNDNDNDNNDNDDNDNNEWEYFHNAVDPTGGIGLWNCSLHEKHTIVRCQMWFLVTPYVLPLSNASYIGLSRCN